MSSPIEAKCDSEYIEPNHEWKTVYNENYKPHDILQPRPQHNQPVVFDSVDIHKLPVREFPYIPMVPHRVACYDIPIGPGLSTPDMKTWK